MIFPHLNQGTEMAAIESDDPAEVVSRRVGHIFGWLSDDHMRLASKSICDAEGVV